MILNEIGILGDGSETYEKADRSKKEITDENQLYSEQLGYTLSENEKALPTIYWIPVVVMLIISAVRLKLLEPRQKRKIRRLWLKSWRLQRERIGTCNNLVNELCLTEDYRYNIYDSQILKKSTFLHSHNLIQVIPGHPFLIKKIKPASQT